MLGLRHAVPICSHGQSGILPTGRASVKQHAWHPALRSPFPGAAPLPRHPHLPPPGGRGRHAALRPPHPQRCEEPAAGPVQSQLDTHSAIAAPLRLPRVFLCRPCRCAALFPCLCRPCSCSCSCCPHDPWLACSLSLLAGDVVFMSTYALHRSPDVWEEPLRFDPDRCAVHAAPRCACCTCWACAVQQDPGRGFAGAAG